MQIEVAVLTVMGIVLLIMIGLLIAVGRVVYKDAKAHDMNAGGWTAIAILVPNFIGLIIYLVVRNNHEKKYQCSSCKKEVKKDYNVCPNCQAVFGASCSACKHAVSEDMTYCPYCGNAIEQEKTAKTAYKISNKTNIVKPLAIIGSMYIGIMVLAFVAMGTMAYIANEGFGNPQNFSVMCLETGIGNTRKATFKYQDTQSSIKVDKKMGTTLRLDTDISLTKGTIDLTVSDPDQKSIYQAIYEGDKPLETMSLPVEMDGKYVIKIKVNGASGAYEISAN